MAIEALFGFEEAGKVKLLEFIPDPDGSPFPWFKYTKKTELTAGRPILGTDEAKHKGECVDTAEYISHQGRLAQLLVSKAPNGTELVGLRTSSSCGTRTFEEEVNATYYGRRK